ncbi:MAG: OmpH family outer membrane protein [Phycisphaerae bacterium]|jgi:Skp family chaperone for outer membrane proteins
MKKTSFVAMVILAPAVILTGLQYSQAAKDKPVLPVKIGIVSVKEVFEKCLMKQTIEKSLSAEGDKKFNELKKLEDTIEADKTALSKRKQDSADYMTMLKALMLKQSEFEAQKEFYQQEITAMEMQGKEKIYRKILEVITVLAKEKGLDIVLSRDDNYLSRPESSDSAQSPTELVLTTKTHKLLYFNPEFDFTAEALTAMDKANPQ